MKREEAVPISHEELMTLNTLDDVIYHIMECHELGLNVYCDHQGERLYACDGYTYEEYYLLATGIPRKYKDHLDGIVMDRERTNEESVKLTDLIIPVYTYLKELYKAKRDELRNGRGRHL